MSHNIGLTNRQTDLVSGHPSDSELIQLVNSLGCHTIEKKRMKWTNARR